jgi:hypothetical protein
VGFYFSSPSPLPSIAFITHREEEEEEEEELTPGPCPDLMEDRIVLDDRVLGVLSRLIDLLEPAVPVMSFGPCQDAKFVSTEDIPRSACLCGILSYLISYLWFRWWHVASRCWVIP